MQQAVAKEQVQCKTLSNPYLSIEFRYHFLYRQWNNNISIKIRPLLLLASFTCDSCFLRLVQISLHHLSLSVIDICTSLQRPPLHSPSESIISARQPVKLKRKRAFLIMSHRIGIPRSLSLSLSMVYLDRKICIFPRSLATPPRCKKG